MYTDYNELLKWHCYKSTKPYSQHTHTHTHTHTDAHVCAHTQSYIHTHTQTLIMPTDYIHLLHIISIAIQYYF